MRTMQKLFAIVACLFISCVPVAAQSKQTSDRPKPVQTKTTDESASQRAETVLRLAREAKGGEEKLKQVTDLIYSGDYITYDPSGNRKQLRKQLLTMFLYRAQKVRTDVEDTSSGFDGKTFWINDTVQSDRASYETRRRAIREWFISILFVPSDMKMSAIALPDSEIDGKPVAVIAFEIGESKFRISFDKQTYLALKLSYGMMGGNDEMLVDEVQEDYKSVGGIKFAHRQIGLENGKMAGEVIVKEYKLNSGIDPVKFTHK